MNSSNLTGTKNSELNNIAVHIFSTSAAMVGVCLTVIGLFKISDRLKRVSLVSDQLLAIDAGLFLVSCLLSYLVLRTREENRRFKIEKWADVIFLTALSVMAVVCSLIAYEYI